MITIKEGNERKVLEHDGKFYTCIIGPNKELVSYSNMEYITMQGDMGKLDLKKLEEDLYKIVNFNIITNIKNIKDADSYCDFIKEMKSEQSLLYRILSAIEYTKEQGNNSLDGLEKVLIKHVDLNEKIFVEQVLPQIPKNWPYLMFHESSWSAYDYYRNLHKMACGQVDFAAEEEGLTLRDINGYSKENKKREMEVYNGLSDAILELNQGKTA